MKRILIAGYGMLGQALATDAIKRGQPVISLSRSNINRLDSLHQHIICDFEQCDLQLDLGNEDYGVYYLAPPSPDEFNDTRLQNFLSAIVTHHIGHIVYMSTSGVYGDCQGRWISEQSPVNPQTDRAKRRVAAEQILKEHQQQCKVPVSILRVGGIYSSKTINLKRLKNNKRPVICPDQAPYSNRIHIDDLMRVCQQVMQKPAANIEIYNVSDGRPSTTTAFAWLVSDIAGLPRVDCVTLEQAPTYYSDTYMSYLLESRRMDTRKLMDSIKPELQYTDITQGIKQCLSSA